MSILVFPQLRRLSCIAVGLLYLAVCSTHASADDWPRWMGPKYDGVWHEIGMIDHFPESGPNIIWRQPLGAGYSGPSIADGKIFAMDRTKDDGVGIKTENDIRKAGEIAGGERIVCLDLKSGAVIWSHQYDCPYKIAYPTGPRCTPTVDGEFVYTLGAMGHLKCLTVADGDVVWEKMLTEEYKTRPPLWGYASHPFVDGDKLIVPVGCEVRAPAKTKTDKDSDKQPHDSVNENPALGVTGIVAFDKRTGKEIWRAVKTRDVAYAPVVIYDPPKSNGERQLIFWHGEGVTSLNPENGKEFWNVKFPEEANPSIVSIATPVITGNQLLIAEFYKGAMLLELGSNPPSATEIWRNFKQNPKLDDAMNIMMATPVVRNGFAYGIANNGRGQGLLRCIELKSGDMVWTDETWMGGSKPLNFSSAFITPNEEKYFIFNDIGELMIGKLSPSGFDELDRGKLLEPTSVARGRDVVWSHPAFSDGKIIVRNDKEIICVDLKK